MTPPPQPTRTPNTHPTRQQLHSHGLDLTGIYAFAFDDIALLSLPQLTVERRSGFSWREAVAAPGTPMVTSGQAGSLAAAPCR
jgi:hypothetical protein